MQAKQINSFVDPFRPLSNRLVCGLCIIFFDFGLVTTLLYIV